jgi:N-hydroxyarylamine O-acetyltransferase
MVGDVMNVQDYLYRINYNTQARADLKTLCGLQPAHMKAIPFENLNISLKKRIQLDLPSLWHKIIIDKRGGFCYELNGLFAWLLKEIGYEVTCLNGRHYQEEEDSFGIDFTHLSLMVKVPNDSVHWLVDVGYGDSFTIPIKIDDKVDHIEGSRSYWVEAFREGYQLWRKNSDGSHTRQYHFDLTPHQFPAEYEAGCIYHQTSPKSTFTQKRVISKLTDDGRITLDEEKLVITKNEQRTEIPVQENERAGILKKYFDVIL